MTIHKYQVINKIKDTKLPFYDAKKDIFFIPIKTKYRYYVEAIVPDGEGGNNYYILLGNIKFDTSCKICHTDNYGRVQVKVRGEIKDFIIRESIERANVNITYIESTSDYDVYEVN